MAEKNLNKFTINYLTEEQYAGALAAGTLNDNDFYCTSESQENEESNLGAGAIIISTENTAEDNYDKLLSAIEYLEDRYQIHLIKNIIFEDVAYNADWNSMPIYSFPVTAEGSASEWWIAFHGQDDQHIYDYVVHAAIVDGVKQFDYTTNVRLGTPINHLDSNSEDEILSANQGRVLNEKILALEARIAELEAGGIDLAVNPTDTTNRNIWIETE